MVTDSPTRPDWDEYWLMVCEVIKLRSDCERDKVGAVVIGTDRRIRSSGYNGGPAGMAGCSTCPRRTSNVDPGSSYDNCIAIHAEANALLYCDRRDLPGSTLYVSRKPCYACTKLIVGAGVARLVYPGGELTNMIL